MVKQGTLREELSYRLKVFPIHVPALRQRNEDIPKLVRYFTHLYARRMNKGIDEIPSETMDALVRYSWPGNVRELQNFIERAVILCPHTVLRAPISELEPRRVLPRGSDVPITGLKEFATRPYPPCTRSEQLGSRGSQWRRSATCNETDLPGLQNAEVSDKPSRTFPQDWSG